MRPMREDKKKQLSIISLLALIPVFLFCAIGFLAGPVAFQDNFLQGLIFFGSLILTAFGARGKEFWEWFKNRQGVRAPKKINFELQEGQFAEMVLASLPEEEFSPKVAKGAKLTLRTFDGQSIVFGNIEDAKSDPQKVAPQPKPEPPKPAPSPQPTPPKPPVQPAVKPVQKPILPKPVTKKAEGSSFDSFI